VLDFSRLARDAAELAANKERMDAEYEAKVQEQFAAEPSRSIG